MCSRDSPLSFRRTCKLERTSNQTKIVLSYLHSTHAQTNLQFRLCALESSATYVPSPAFLSSAFLSSISLFSISPHSHSSTIHTQSYKFKSLLTFPHASSSTETHHIVHDVYQVRQTISSLPYKYFLHPTKRSRYHQAFTSKLDFHYRSPKGI